MTITVNTLKNVNAQKKQWRPQKRGMSSKQIDAEIRRKVLISFRELDYFVSKGGKRFDESVTFATRGAGMHDLVFKTENGLTKWQNAKKWLIEANAWRG